MTDHSHESHHRARMTKARLAWLILGLGAGLAIMYDMLFDRFEAIFTYPVVVFTKFVTASADGIISAISVFGVNILIFEALFLAVLAWLTWLARRTWRAQHVLSAVFALAFSVPFAVFNSATVLFLSVVGLTVANLFLLFFFLGNEFVAKHPVGLFETLMIKPLTGVAKGTDIWSALREYAPKKGNSQTVRSVFLGIGFAIPLLIFFGLLFHSADPVFAESLNRVFSFDVDMDLFGHLFLFILLAPLFTIVLASLAWVRQKDTQRKVSTHPRAHVESIVIVGMVAVLFTVFLLFQIQYLFGGEAAFAAGTLTYAEYARRGFGELSVAAAAVVLLILTLRYLHGVKGGTLLKALYGVLIMETGLLLVSAAMRLGLYIDAFGHTPARLFAGWFIAVTGVLLVMLLVHVLLARHQHAYIKQSLVFTGVAMLALIFTNPDARTLQWNIERMERDPSYAMAVRDIRALSADAVPVVRKNLSKLRLEGLLSRADVDAACKRRDPDAFVDLDGRMRILSWYSSILLATADQKWSAWNLNRMRATNASFLATRDRIEPDRVHRYVDDAVVDWIGVPTSIEAYGEALCVYTRTQEKAHDRLRIRSDRPFIEY